MWTVPFQYEIRGDVRCYCNLPVCVATGYMCRSERGGCFSDMLEREPPTRHNQGVYRARHGCLELLSGLDQRSQCQKLSDDTISSVKVGLSTPGKTFLLCCFKDMCNHVDNPETQRNLLNDTATGLLNNSDSHGQAVLPTPGYNSNEVWFKAATIAVPICGALILFMLIALAVKILRTDGLDTPSNKLGRQYSSAGSEHKTTLENVYDQYHQPNSLKRVPLLMQHGTSSVNTSCINHSADNFITQQTSVPLLVQNQTRTCYEKKNEANAKLNLATSLEYSLLPQHQQFDHQRNNTHKPCNTSNASTYNNGYRSINLSLPQNISSNEEPKLYDKQMTWGPANPSSHV